MSRIRGGQVWKQTSFPFMSCYLVYLGPTWCRIHTPNQIGNIAITSEDESGEWKWQYSTKEMEALLTEHGYELLGQFSEINRRNGKMKWNSEEVADRIREAIGERAKREEELETALAKLIEYTIKVLTGPMFESIKWPEDFPSSHPVLSRSISALGDDRKWN